MPAAERAALLAAVMLGVGLAWVDTLPGWDDTGVMVGALVLASAAFATAFPWRPWRWGIAIGLWLPAWNLLDSGNAASVAALVVALAGAGGGALARRALAGPRR